MASRGAARAGALDVAPAGPPRLAARDLAFRYGEREVLRGVSLEVAPGEILGILGPNGAGKSTLFAVLTGALRPTRGALFLDGVEVAFGARALRARTGVVFQNPSLDAKLTAEENLVLGGLLFGLRRAEARARARALLERAGLLDRARDAVGRLSGGQRRRVELARALVGSPSILLMDEPTSGLDAAAFRRAWDDLEALRRERSLSVVVATHRPDEAEACDRLAVLAGGRVVACETPEALRSRVAGDVVTVEADEPEALAREIAARFRVPARATAHGVHRARARARARPAPGRGVPGRTLPRGGAAPADPRRRVPGRHGPGARGGAVTALAYDAAAVRALAERDLVRFFRQPSRLVGALGQPVLFWLVIGSGMASTFRLPGAAGVGYLPFFYPGVVMMVVLFAAIFTTVSVIEDRRAGFLQAVLAGPGSRAALAVGKVAGSSLVALTQAALFLALAPAAGFRPGAVSWALLAAALALAAVALGALAFAVAWLVDSVQGYHAIQMTLLTPMWVVSGAMFPASPDHPALAAVMRANPISYAVSAARRALSGPLAPGALPGSAARDLAVVAAFAAASLALAILAARRRR